MQKEQLIISSAPILIFLLLSLCDHTIACTEQERQVLLSFLGNLSPSPGDSFLSSWRGPDCCTWDGVACGGDGAVVRVWLPGRGLGGGIAPSLANLTALTHLNLSRNNLAGVFPPALLSLRNATVVDVSWNRLSGVLPEMPQSARGWLLLQVLDVSSNFLEGQFPSMIWALTPSLVSLNASNNSFVGSMPPFCISCPQLSILDLSLNQFGGIIPLGFGRCSQLRVICAGRNNFTGELPDDLFDATSLQRLALPYNQIQGRLDTMRVAKLSNLVTFDLSRNALTGGLPESISTLRKLEELRVGYNGLTGTIPAALSNCTSLRCLDLRSNTFFGDLAAVDFSRLHNLSVLDVLFNNFTGTIPQSVYSCASLTALRVGGNHIGGQIAPEIGNLEQLQFISLTINSFTNMSGMLWNLQGCKNLAALLVSYNFYGEALPDAGWVGDHVRSVRVLVMENCGLKGQIPSWLSKLQDLNILDLAGNHLTGPIPSWLGSLPNLYYIDLSNNHLSGEIPPSLTALRLLTSEQAMKEFKPGHLPLAFTLTPNNNAASRRQNRGYYQMSGVATTLNFSDTGIAGVISPMMGQMKVLQVLDISCNNLSGSIPPELTSLTKLEILDLRMNRLTGTIPLALNKLHFLSQFNVSYNDLEGKIPTGGQFDTFPPSSFAANPKLCGPAIAVSCTNGIHYSGGKPSSKTKLQSKRFLVAITLGVSLGLVAIVVLLGCFVMAIRRVMSGTGSCTNDGTDAEASLFNSVSELHCDDGSNETIFVMSETDGGGAAKSITFVDIVKATSNFSPASIVGSGGYGLVYRAELEDGTKLAVKRVNGDMCLVEREFRAEVEALSAARHENLVPLHGFCIRGGLRLLLYSYMEHGSLYDWLHERADSGEVLDWPARLNIARGASRGVLHIHKHCKPQIVHRDIKSSNILLDDQHEARVADFGLARLILPDRTHVTTELVGTAGYIPPEYGQAWMATRRGDVYSFGVVLLELLTGRRPIEMRPSGQWELVKWVQQMTSLGKHAEVLDHRLRGKGDDEQMLYVLDLACLCVDSTPFSRPEIEEVVSWLENADTIGRVAVKQ